MKKYYLVYDATQRMEYNRIGIGLKNPVDQIGQDMINHGETALLDYQYVVATIMVLCAIFVFVVVICYFKQKEEHAADQEAPQNVVVRNNINASN